MKTIEVYDRGIWTTYQLASFGDRFIARFLDMLVILIPSFIIPLAGWLYWSAMQSSDRQATVGQRAMNIKVLSIKNGNVGFGRATGRYFANILNIFTFLIGYFLYFFTEKKQCLHDILAGTVVVKKVPLSVGEDYAQHLVEF